MAGGLCLKASINIVEYTRAVNLRGGSACQTQCLGTTGRAYGYTYFPPDPTEDGEQMAVRLTSLYYCARAGHTTLGTRTRSGGVSPRGDGDL